MSALYPAVDPHRSGHFDATGGHRIYFEVSGNPVGRPVLFLHGGPGSSTRPDHRRYFDPACYRIVLFDQRGCGRSTPAGGTANNTTAHLIGDIEQLRLLLGVDRWVLFGGSWGSTLALAYAQTYPDRVTHLILRGIFLASHGELDWYFDGLRQFVPAAREALYAATPGVPWLQLVRAYDAALRHPDPAVQVQAAARWNAFESAVMSIGEAPVAGSPAGAVAEEAGLARARVQVHYLTHNCFFRPGELLDGVVRIAHLPGILLQGAMDFVCPPVTAFEVARRWPSARLSMIAAAKHAASHPHLESALVAATDSLRDQLVSLGTVAVVA